MLSEELYQKLFNELSSENEIFPKILNRPVDLYEYDKSIIDSTPEMTGKNGSKALHEIHIFFLPLAMGKNELDEKVVQKYRDTINIFNKHSNIIGDIKPMKDPILALNFRDVGYVTVMQSSLYVLSNSKQDVITLAHQIANLFSVAGLQVVREKIEASAFGIDGIPQTAEEAKKYNKYFEYHIRVARKNDQDTTKSLPLSEEEIGELETISKQFSEKFGVPVPLSYNKSKEGTEGGYQRYLNLRCRDMGSPDASKQVHEISQAIVDETSFKVVKVISEYVWYDTYVGLDKGWIDF